MLSALQAYPSTRPIEGETLKFERSPSINSKRGREVASRLGASHIPHRDPLSSELSIFTLLLPKRPQLFALTTPATAYSHRGPPDMARLFPIPDLTLMVPLPHPGESPLATAPTRVGDSITAPASSPGSPKSFRASQPRRDRAHAPREHRAAGAVVGAATRGPVRALGTGARGGGGPYLPRRSRGSAWLRLLRLDYSPASRALLEYIPSSREGRGCRGGGAGREQQPRGAWAPATPPLSPW